MQNLKVLNVLKIHAGPSAQTLMVNITAAWGGRSEVAIFLYKVSSLGYFGLFVGLSVCLTDCLFD